MKKKKRRCKFVLKSYSLVSEAFFGFISHIESPYQRAKYKTSHLSVLAELF